MHETTGVYDWQRLSEELLATFGDTVEARGNPTVVRVFAGRSGDDLTFETGDDPRFVIGWVAPPGCVAVALVATGHARAVGTYPPTGFAARGLSRLRMCCVVSRSAEVGWTMTGCDGRSPIGAPTEGRMLDALKRCFGLPTPPAGVPASELHSAAWAASVLEQAVESPKPLTWSDVARAHPLARLLAGDLPVSPVGAEAGAGELGDLLRIAANAWSWGEIHEQACSGRLAAIIHPSIAVWMDDGMFSRWLLDRVPPLDQLLGALQAYLAPSAATRFELALRRDRPRG